MAYSKVVSTYKKSGDYTDLKLHISSPKDRREDRPVILFFHGAGFSNNKVNASQFQHQAAHFNSLGMVAICAEYRPFEREGLFSPIDSLLNAKSAIRWVREKADELGVDPKLHHAIYI